MSPRLRPPGALGIAALALFAAGGCGGEESQAGGEPGNLTVSAASSLTEAFEAYGASLPGEEKFSFAGSDELAAQLRQGARPDVFASANTELPDELFEEGLVEPPVVFARNRLVIAVPRQVAISDVSALGSPGLDVVIGAEGVPVGDYAREVLDRLPASERDAILANVRSEEPEVKGIVGKLVTGAADAGFVYASDVAAAGGDLEAVELPDELEPEISYGIAVVKGAAEPERAQEFVDGLLEGEGAEALAAADFRPPPG